MENALIGVDGEILTLIVEAGGFLDIGDTHVAVPWDQVDLSEDADRIEVPVDADNVLCREARHVLGRQVPSHRQLPIRLSS